MAVSRDSKRCVFNEIEAAVRSSEVGWWVCDEIAHGVFSYRYQERVITTWWPRRAGMGVGVGDGGGGVEWW